MRLQSQSLLILLRPQSRYQLGLIAAATLLPSAITASLAPGSTRELRTSSLPASSLTTTSTWGRECPLTCAANTGLLLGSGSKQALFSTTSTLPTATIADLTGEKRCPTMEQTNNGEVEVEKKQEEEKALPKLTAAEFKAYNSMSELMNLYHNHFRATWTMMYDACVANKRPSGMSLGQFISQGLQFIQHLTMHHGIEEAHIFPLLATKMPEFVAEVPAGSKGKGYVEAAELLQQHKLIHAGMDKFQAYLRGCLDGEQDFRFSDLKAQMDTWGGVLWKHLDQEVKTLGAENMRRYWTLEEMKAMPF